MEVAQTHGVDPTEAGDYGWGCEPAQEVVIKTVLKKKKCKKAKWLSEEAL